jgi:hypothetical protein
MGGFAMGSSKIDRATMNDDACRAFTVRTPLRTATSQHTDPLPRRNWPSACTATCRALDATTRERDCDCVVDEFRRGAPVTRRADCATDDEHVGSRRGNL